MKDAPNLKPECKPRLKRWPISQKKRTETYGAISEEIMLLRIEVKQGPRKLTKYEIDELLFKLNKDIWRKVCATLGIPT